MNANNRVLPLVTALLIAVVSLFVVSGGLSAGTVAAQAFLEPSAEAPVLLWQGLGQDASVSRTPTATREGLLFAASMCRELSQSEVCVGGVFDGNISLFPTEVPSQTAQAFDEASLTVIPSGGTKCAVALSALVARFPITWTGVKAVGLIGDGECNDGPSARDLVAQLNQDGWETFYIENEHYTGPGEHALKGAVKHFFEVPSATPREVVCALRGGCTLPQAVATKTSVAFRDASPQPAPGTVQPGDRVVYTILVTNTGEIDIAGMTISDTIPVDTTFVPNSARSNGDSLTISNTIVATKGSLVPGQVLSLTLAVIVNPNPVGAYITNTAVVRADNVDPEDPSEVLTVELPPMCELFQVDSWNSPQPRGAQVDVGQLITYTVVVTNNNSVGTGCQFGQMWLNGKVPTGTLLIPWSVRSNLPGILPYTINRNGYIVIWKEYGLAERESWWLQYTIAVVTLNPPTSEIYHDGYAETRYLRMWTQPLRNPLPLRPYKMYLPVTLR